MRLALLLLVAALAVASQALETAEETVLNHEIEAFSQELDVLNPEQITSDLMGDLEEDEDPSSMAERDEEREEAAMDKMEMKQDAQLVQQEETEAEHPNRAAREKKAAEHHGLVNIGAVFAKEFKKEKAKDAEEEREVMSDTMREVSSAKNQLSALATAANRMGMDGMLGKMLGGKVGELAEKLGGASSKLGAKLDGIEDHIEDKTPDFLSRINGQAAAVKDQIKARLQKFGNTVGGVAGKADELFGQLAHAINQHTKDMSPAAQKWGEKMQSNAHKFSKALYNEDGANEQQAVPGVTNDPEDADPREQEAEPTDESEDKDDNDIEEQDTTDALGDYSDHPSAIGGIPAYRHGLSFEDVQEVPPEIKDDLSALADHVALIIKNLKAKRQKIFDKDVFMKDKIKKIDGRIAFLKADIAKIKRESRIEKRVIGKADKTQFVSREKTLEQELKQLIKGREWAMQLTKKVKILGSSKPGMKVYETTLADIKEDLADNLQTAETITGEDIAAQLEDLDDFSTSVSDLAEGKAKRKLFETKRLHSLTSRMVDAVNKKIAAVEKELKKLREGKVPKHLAEGIRRAEAEIARLQAERKKIQEELKKKGYNAQMKRIDEELKKLDKVGRTATGQAKTEEDVEDDDE